ncbi:MAG: hypothetical protein WAQ53_03620 [Thiofilum sp.]|uniref:hypothetical protein n=1 Tax=Thiofilum sp. TaxID=2212733 RepID=UPI0025EC3301|nr:hypothetical protein [Thiofilum sp.]MBK8454779.1 hypothetical protein [Thiofilum sp.]
MNLRLNKTLLAIWAILTLICLALSTATTADSKAPQLCKTYTAQALSCGFGMVSWSDGSVKSR